MLTHGVIKKNFSFVRWCECMVEALVEVTYVVSMAALRHIHQLIWPRNNSLGVVTSSSFDVVIHGARSDNSYQTPLDFLEEPEPSEDPYETLGDQGHYMSLEGEDEDEDEGVVMEGDAGFPWDDSRVEQWRWEEEHGEGDYREEDDDVEDIFEFQYGDEEEDWG